MEGNTGTGWVQEIGCSVLFLVFLILLVMLFIGSVGASINWWLE